LYFKDFPLEQVHPWAKPAAIAGRCVFQQNPEAFWLYHDWVFDEQSEITPENLRSKLMDFAKGKEIDTLRLGRCLDTKATEAEVDRSIAEGKVLQVNSTPTLFVNGRRIPSQVAWDQLQTLIRSEIEYQKTAKNAGDQSCCEVTLPSPLSK
jgi:protein-disulfide isomerase